MLALNTDLDGAIALGEKIRQSVEEENFLTDVPSEREQLTVSVGVACFGGDQKQFFKKADSALYEAKGADSEKAQAKLNADHPDATFYSGKIQTARFFIYQILPGAHAKAVSFASDDTSLLDIEL